MLYVHNHVDVSALGRLVDLHVRVRDCLYLRPLPMPLRIEETAAPESSIIDRVIEGVACIFYMEAVSVKEALSSEDMCICVGQKESVQKR